MKIEICEGDGYLYEDIQPRNFILIVDGRRMIYPADKKISELVALVDKLCITPGPKKESEVVGVFPGLGVVTRDMFKIEMFDEVEYIGPVDPDNKDLVVGRHYTIQKVGITQHDIVDWNSPTPIRLAVFVSWVKLVKKHDPALLNKKTVVFDITYTCDCGKILALLRPEGAEEYKGKCECGKEYNIPRSEIDKVKNAAAQGDGVFNPDISAVNPKIVLKLK